MPALREIATVALVLLPSAAVGVPAAAAAPPSSTAAAEPIGLEIDRSAWSWRRAVPALGLPAEEPSQVPPGGLAVAADLDPAGNPAKATYLHLDLAAVPATSQVAALTLALPLHPAEDDLDAADVRLVACELKAEFTPGEGLDPATMPEADCTTPAVGAFDPTTRTWAFTLTGPAQGWLQDPTSNHGVVIRPPVGHALPDGRPFQVNFVGPAEIRAELEVSVPAAAPGTPPVDEPTPPPVHVEQPPVVSGGMPAIPGGSLESPTLPTPPQSAPVIAPPVASAPVAAVPPSVRVLAPARSTTGALWSLAALVALLLVGVARVVGNTAGPAAFASLERQRLDRIRLATPGQVETKLVPDAPAVHVPQRRQGRSPISSATSTVT